jgi:hypothetical protein
MVDRFLELGDRLTVEPSSFRLDIRILNVGQQADFDGLGR